MEAREYIKGLMEKAGLTIREDVMGNTFGGWQGSDPKAGVHLLADIIAASSNMTCELIALCA